MHFKFTKIKDDQILILWHSSPIYFLLLYFIHLSSLRKTTFKLRFLHRNNWVRIRFDSNVKWHVAEFRLVCEYLNPSSKNGFVHVKKSKMTRHLNSIQNGQRALKQMLELGKINIKLAVYSSVNSFEFPENEMAMHFMECSRVLWSYSFFLYFISFNVI